MNSCIFMKMKLWVGIAVWYTINVHLVFHPKIHIFSIHCHFSSKNTHFHHNFRSYRTLFSTKQTFCTSVSSLKLNSIPWVHVSSKIWCIKLTILDRISWIFTIEINTKKSFLKKKNRNDIRQFSTKMIFFQNFHSQSGFVEFYILICNFWWK